MEHNVFKLPGVLNLMTKYEGHWPELYVEVCNKYRVPVLKPPEHLEDVDVVTTPDLENPTPAQVANALSISNEMVAYEEDKRYGGF
eukprot:4505968-Heterocapsa_arctica.AAC.1